MAETTNTYTYTPPERSVFTPPNEGEKITNQGGNALPETNSSIQVKPIQEKK